MGRSVSAWTPPSGTSEHKLSGSRLQVSIRNGRMIHRVERRGMSAEYPVSIALGSGKVGQRYAIRIRDALLESPI
jgi:hypothetical protein